MSKFIEMKLNIDSRNFNFWGICDKKNLLFGLDLMTAYLSDADFEELVLFETGEALKPIDLDRAKSPVAVIENQYRKFMIGNDHMASARRTIAFLDPNGRYQEIAPSHLPKRGGQIQYRRRLRSRNDCLKIQSTFRTLPLRSFLPNSINENGVHFPQTISEKSFFFTGDNKGTVSI
jgi:hypothetical protein